MKVLVVDDAATIRKQLVKILGDLGFEQVLEAPCVQDAMIMLDAEPGVGLIFSDWHMPKHTGLDFLRMVRANPAYSAIPFVMLTTEQERGKILEAARLGLQSYIFKPVQKDIIRSRLTTLGLLPEMPDSVAAAAVPT